MGLEERPRAEQPLGYWSPEYPDPRVGITCRESAMKGRPVLAFIAGRRSISFSRLSRLRSPWPIAQWSQCPRKGLGDYNPNAYRQGITGTDEIAFLGDPSTTLSE